MTIHDPFIGQQIGNYRILKRINSGSFGSVYQAQHLIFDDEPIVAIKVLHASLASEEHTAFMKEAQLLKKLQHPHILHILDAGFHNGLPYLVTEYASGGSLRDRLRKNNSHPLPVDEAVSILTQIGEALSYAHQQGIVHRDLKPENILFNNGNVLLADFGIAVLLESTHTGMMGLGGTPPYMAPEQFEGLVSAKSDQYALGCIAYELATGHRLFSLQNPTLEAFWYHHAKVEPVPPKHYNSALPMYLERAILTALAKDRMNRYRDIASFMLVLSRDQEQWMTDAELFFKSRRYHEALASYEQGIQINPNYAAAYVGKGRVLNELKRYKEALAAYERAIYLDPNYAVTYVGKGIALIGLKHYEEALMAYEQAIHLDPNSANAYYSKGIALTGLKRYEEALMAYEQAIHLDPNNVLAYSNKGTVLTQLKRHEEALMAYEQAIRLDSNRAVFYSNKAKVLNELKRYKEALIACSQAFHLDPNYAATYNNMGVALYHLKRYEEALIAYEQAIDLDPNYAVAYVGKGATLAELKRHEEALMAYEQAIYLDANYANAYYNAGVTLNELRRYEEALDAYEQAIRLDPNNAQTYHNKGYILARLGKSREAREAFTRAKSLGNEG